MRRVLLGLGLLVVLAAPGARAQMPDLRAMAGKPLPVQDMAPGTVSVRLARQVPSNPLADVEVTAVITASGGDARKRSAKTGADGRATFEGIAYGSQFQAEATVDGERLQTAKFTVPPQGGTRVMLIAGLGSEPAPPSEEQQFALGAVTGQVAPQDGLPKGTLELALVDGAGMPIADRAVRIGQVGSDNTVKVIKGTSDAAGLARFTELATGEGTGYAAVIEHDGMRLGTEAFRMPDDKGARGHIKALARTSDKAVLGIDGRSKIILDVREDALAVMQQLVFKNTSEDKIFDASPEGLLIPLPDGFAGAQELGGGAPLEVKPDEGMLVRSPIPPNRAAMAAVQARLGFVMPAEGAGKVKLEQPMPFGMESPLLLVPGSAGFTIEAAGVKPLADQSDAQGGVVKLYELPSIAPGGTLSVTVSGLPAYDRGGRSVVAVLCALLVAAALVGARRPRGATTDGADKLHERRETLFAELVELERARKAGGDGGRTDERRREVVAKLEGIYREIAKRESGQSTP